MNENSSAKSSGGNKVKKILALPLLVIAASALTLFGQLVGQFTVIIQRLVPSLKNNDVWVTGKMYLEFMGIWILCMIVFAAVRKNRPLFGALGNKVHGNTPKFMLLGLGIGFGMNAFCAVIALIKGDIHIYYNSFNPFVFLYLFIVILIQSSAEELVCRCFLYQRLMRAYHSPLLAIITNSLLFGAMHLLNPDVSVLGITSILLSGLIFSLCIYYFDSFWCCAMIHTAWNFTQNIIFGLPNSGNVVPYSIFKLDAGSAVKSFAYDPGFGIEGTALSCVVQAAVVIIIFLWGRKHGAKPTDIWEKNTFEISETATI